MLALGCVPMSWEGACRDTSSCPRRCWPYCCACQIAALLEACEAEKALAGAAAVNAEQTCAALELKYVALAEEQSAAEREKSALAAQLSSLEEELAQSRSQVHQLNLSLVFILAPTAPSSHPRFSGLFHSRSWTSLVVPVFRL